jgi:hypothetical protein
MLLVEKLRALGTLGSSLGHAPAPCLTFILETEVQSHVSVSGSLLVAGTDPTNLYQFCNILPYVYFKTPHGLHGFISRRRR